MNGFMKDLTSNNIIAAMKIISKKEPNLNPGDLYVKACKMIINKKK